MGSHRVSMTYYQHRYVVMLKRSKLETFDLSWPCLTPAGKLFNEAELAAHREVVKAFKNMGVS